MKPKGIALMLLKQKREDDTGDDESDDSEPEMPKGEEVAQEFIDAVKSGDAAGVWKAFRGLSACAGEDDTDDSDDE